MEIVIPSTIYGASLNGKKGPHYAGNDKNKFFHSEKTLLFKRSRCKKKLPFDFSSAGPKAPGELIG